MKKWAHIRIVYPSTSLGEPVERTFWSGLNEVDVIPARGGSEGLTRLGGSVFRVTKLPVGGWIGHYLHGEHSNE